MQIQKKYPLCCLYEDLPNDAQLCVSDDIIQNWTTNLMIDWEQGMIYSRD